MRHQHHNLKTLPHFFQQTWDGDKLFEIRFNGDRQYQKDDTVTLKEYDPNKSAVEGSRYTRREITGRITFVTTFAQVGEFVVFGLFITEKEDNRRET